MVTRATEKLPEIEKARHSAIIINNMGSTNTKAHSEILEYLIAKIASESSTIERTQTGNGLTHASRCPDGRVDSVATWRVGGETGYESKQLLLPDNS